MSGTVSQDLENKLDKQASSLPLMARGISGPAELGALTEENVRGYRKGTKRALRCHFWRDEGRNGAASTLDV